MLRFRSSFSRYYSFKNATQPFPTLSRSFWWGDKEPESMEANHPVIVESSDSKQLVPQFGDSIPRLSPVLILPTSTKPLFPGTVGVELLHNKEILDAIVKSKNNGASYVGMFYRKHPVSPDLLEPEVITNMDDIHRIGTFASIQSITDTKTGGKQLFLSGHRRITLDHFDTLGPPAYGRITHWKKTDVPVNTPTIKAYINEITYCIRYIVSF